MKKLITTCKAIMVTMVLTMMSTNVQAQEVHGWPYNYKGVMLQGFYWDSFSKTKWKKLTAQADEICSAFDLVWIPQSGKAANDNSMGYDPKYWFPDGNQFSYTSSFGNEQELRDMIKAFKDRGTGTIADVVLNHRGNLSNWVDFPKEVYNGSTYELKSTDICKDDDGGSTLTWANANGYSLSSNNDQGEGWDGMRDLDHQSANVQKCVKAYLKMLLEDLGYVGFRYDMVKGYPASYTGMYNKAAGVEYSVGEYWDGTQAIRNWIDGTKVDGWPTSAAFDFQFKYVVNNAANNNNWKNLSGQNDSHWPLVSSSYENGNYRQWAITFLENHDTEVRPDGTSNGPLTKNILPANAYMMGMPGTPCVFLKHWLDYKKEIAAMIDVRKAAGIHNRSYYLPFLTNEQQYVVCAGESATDLRLATAVGNLASSWSNNKYTKVLEGSGYAFFMSKSLNTAWADKPSGKYDKAFQVKLTAVSNTTGVQLVYTTNGSNPTASSTKVSSGSTITIPLGETTLKVGLLISGAVSGIVTRTYKVEEPAPFTPYTITINVCAEKVGWNDYVNFHSWGDERTGTAWPGDKVTTTKTTTDGKKWFYKSYNITSADDYVNLVFSIGTAANANQNQTVDANDFTQDAWLEISDTKDGTKYLINDVTSSYTTAIGAITTQTENTDNRWYNINGQVLNGQPTQKGIYINNGKKYIVK